MATRHPFAIFVRHPDGTVNFLAGHGSLDGRGMETVCLFTDDPAEAVTSASRDVLLMGWPSLLSSHCRTMGIKLQATVQRTNAKQAVELAWA